MRTKKNNPALTDLNKMSVNDETKKKETQLNRFQ
jgi:hypothetical protein